MSYRYIAADLRTGQKIAELPLTGVKYQKVLNGAGTLSCAMTLPNSNPTLAQILVDATTPTRRALYIDRDGVIMWAGIIWTRRYDTATSVCDLQGAELWSLFKRRRISDLETFTAIDQCTIAENLITYTQAKTGGSIGVVNAGVTSGVTRTRTYLAADLKPVAEAIEQLAAVSNGFEFAIDTDYQSGVITNTFRCSYPRRGRAAGTNGHVFEVGRNVAAFQWNEDGTSAANTVYAVGADSGTGAIRSTGTGTTAVTAGYPLLEDNVSYTDVTVQATLDAHATAEVTASEYPIELPQMVVRADMNPVLGEYIVGDEVRIRIQPNEDPRFPMGLDRYNRIVAYSVDVPDTGEGENVTLTLDLPI